MGGRREHSLVAGTFVRSLPTQRLAGDPVQGDGATGAKSPVGSYEPVSHDSVRSLEAEPAGGTDAGALQHWTRDSLQG
jgi:hypothetical protein